MNKVGKNAFNTIITLESVTNAALDWWDQPLLRKQVKTNSKIKQQTVTISKTLYPLKKHIKKMASGKTEKSKKVALH